MSSPLLICGSVAIDTIRTPSGSASDQLGGSAVFAALVARHFCAPLILSAIGEDFPSELLERLNGLHLNHLTRDADGKSFRWEGVYDDTLGHRETVGLDLGVMATAKLQHPESISNVKVAMMGNYHPARLLEVLPYLPKDCFIATDTIHAWINYERAALGELISRSHLVTLNEDELPLYTKNHDEAASAKQVLAEGPKYLIVKYGEKGSRLYTREGKIYNVGVYKTQAKDTTGAGDSFLGGLCAHLSHLDKVSDEALLQGMKLGAAAASFTVEAFGVERLINVGKEQIEARLKEVA